MALAATAVGAAPGRDETFRSLRDQAAEIESEVQAGNHPDWLDTNTHQAAAAAGTGLGREQHDALQEGLPVLDACRDLGQGCRSGRPADVTGTPAADGQTTAVEPGKQRSPDAGNLTAADITITILASRALGDAQLKEVFALTAGSPRVRVAFRGVAKDEPLAAFVRQIHGLLAGIQPVPEVVLDPRPFQAPLVDIAPVLIASGPKGELARVAGLADPQWLLARVLAGARGNLGVRGPVLAVSEPDLVGELKRRLGALDLSKLREQALARYWKQVGFETLPVAAHARTRAIDPTITAAADLPLPDGSLLVRAGDTLNPLDRLPFTERLVVFDATDQRQVRTAVRLGREAGTRRVVYLATRLERRWEGLAAVEDALDAPVYLLTPEVRSRFALERVPAYVEAAGRLFRVAEVPPEGSP